MSEWRWLHCERCGWSDMAKQGSLLVSRSEAGACVGHEVVHLHESVGSA